VPDDWLTDVVPDTITHQGDTMATNYALAALTSGDAFLTFDRSPVVEGVCIRLSRTVEECRADVVGFAVWHQGRSGGWTIGKRVHVSCTPALGPVEDTDLSPIYWQDLESLDNSGRAMHLRAIDNGDGTFRGVPYECSVCGRDVDYF
jgi:hypothetical protein